ncbi:tRNA(m5U54)methyltransferase [Batrachochytrium dendrobatidis]|nr:tRNA(m5U54)methyltransferase [Batrachochytrium dendrobatidis]
MSAGRLYRGSCIPRIYRLGRTAAISQINASTVGLGLSYPRLTIHTKHTSLDRPLHNQTLSNPVAREFDLDQLAKSLLDLLPQQHIPYLDHHLHSPSDNISVPPYPSTNPLKIDSMTDPIPVVLTNKNMTMGIAVGRGNWLYMVPGVFAGEVVMGKVYQNLDGVSLIHLTNVVKSHPDRVQSPCRHFNTCGGCQMMHMSYDRQMSMKHDRVWSAFVQTLGESLAGHLVMPTLSTSKQTGYRHYIHGHRGKVPVGQQMDCFGFLGKGEANQVIDIDSCSVSNTTVNTGFASMKNTMRLIRNYGPMEQPASKHFICATVSPPNNMSFSEFLPQFIHARNVVRQAKLHGIHSGIDDKDLIQAKKVLASWGSGIVTNKETIVTSLVDDTIIRFPAGHSPLDNLYLVPTMVSFIRDLIHTHLPAQDRHTLVDAYCRSGVFGLLLAPLFEHVVAIEAHTSLSKCAFSNAADNQINNYTLHNGSVEEWFSTLSNQPNLQVSMVFCHSPVQGLSVDALDRLLQFGPRMIVLLHADAYIQSLDVAYLLGFKRFKEMDILEQHSNSEFKGYNHITKKTWRSLSSRRLFDLDGRYAAKKANVTMVDQSYRILSITPVDILPHQIEVGSVTVLIKK